MNPKADFFFAGNGKWHEEYALLRAAILECPLSEELKWGCPCYTDGDANIVLIHGFKEYCAVLFFKGVLLNDPDGVLIRQTENVQAARQMRFTNVNEVIEKIPVLKKLVREAIEVEKSGLKVPMKKSSEFKMAEEFQKALETTEGLKVAFEALTPGRQRAYLLHFSSPKLAATREARVMKSIPRILGGKGLDDQDIFKNK